MSRFDLLRAMLPIVLVAGCAGSLAPTRPTPGPSQQPEPTSAHGCPGPREEVPQPSVQSLVATIYLGCQAGAVAASGDSVWVVPHLDRVALRIDPTTNSVVAGTPLGDRGPGAEIAATDGMVWASVSSPTFDLERIVRIDPGTGAIVASLELAAAFPVIGAGFAWAGAPDTVYRIDPVTNTVAASIPVGFGCWVTILGGRVFCIGSGQAVEIDPTTDAVVPVKGVPSGLPVEAADGLVWGVDGDSLWAFNVTTGLVEADLRPPPGSASWSLDAVVVAGALWATAGDGSGPPHRLIRIDREARAVDCVIETPISEFGIGAGFGSIWLPVISQPWLVRIDPSC